MNKSWYNLRLSRTSLHDQKQFFNRIRKCHQIKKNRTIVEDANALDDYVFAFISSDMF
jgi:hypothetical protein